MFSVVNKLAFIKLACKSSSTTFYLEHLHTITRATIHCSENSDICTNIFKAWKLWILKFSPDVYNYVVSPNVTYQLILKKCWYGIRHDINEMLILELQYNISMKHWFWSFYILIDHRYCIYLLIDWFSNIFYSSMNTGFAQRDLLTA